MLLMKPIGAIPSLVRYLLVAAVNPWCSSACVTAMSASVIMGHPPRVCNSPGIVLIL